MKKTFIFIIFILIFNSNIFSDVIVKSNKDLKNYIEYIPELDLYLFDSFNSNAQYIEKNSKLELCGISDLYKNEQNYIKNINLPLTEKPCKIAIIDTGIDLKHEDIKAFGDNNNIESHGTAIAGIIGAIRDNGKGICGISNPKIFSINIFKNNISTYFNMIKGIIRAVKENCKIISIHCGGIDNSKALKEAIDLAIKNNCIIIASGGNTNSENVLYPAKFDNVISVGSINNEGLPCNEYDWGFNNLGEKLGSCFGKNVDISTFGTNIFSTMPNNKYSSFNGTSFSAAIITGIASYLISNEPEIKLNDLKIKIKEILNNNIILSSNNITNIENDYKTKIIAKNNINEMHLNETNKENNSLTLKCASFRAKFPRRRGHSTIIFKDKIWILGGYEGNRYLDDIWNSSNGINWEKINVSKHFSPRADHSCFVYNDKIWVIGGRSGIEYNDVWCSSDGINWNELSSESAFSKRFGHSSVVFNNKMWVIGGINNNTKHNDVWCSSDGIKWIEKTDNAEFSPRYYHRTIVFNNNIIIVGGVNKNDIWKSKNGLNWELVKENCEFGDLSCHSLNILNNKLYIIAGFSNKQTNNIWNSSDLYNWNKINSTEFSARNLHSSVIFKNKLWIIGGFNGNCSLNDIWYSNNIH